MRILLTNDDGISAPGLVVLREIAATLSSDVWTVAPETNQSGTSHSLTLHAPLRMREIDARSYAVAGTPTDCIIMAVRHLLKDAPPALILSGVNDSANVAEDVTYSGTVAGAMEGTLLGIPSIALSLTTVGARLGGEVYWDTPRTHGPDLIAKLLAAGWPSGTLLNVNFPPVAPDKVAGVTVTRQGVRDQDSLAIDERADPWGKPYYWFGFRYRPSTLVAGTDLAALASNQISVTPLSLDLTNADAAAKLAAVLNSGAARKAAGG